MNIWVINANIEKILELYWKGYSFYEALEIVKGGETNDWDKSRWRKCKNKFRR